MIAVVSIRMECSTMEVRWEINEKYYFQISSKFLCFLTLPKTYCFLHHIESKKDCSESKQKGDLEFPLDPYLLNKN